MNKIVMFSLLGMFACSNTGTDGVDGTNGKKGDIGPPGEQGSSGIDGMNGVDGDAGPKGDIGPIGPTGPTGDTGPTGPTGPAGDTGPQGPNGDAGPAGPTGPQGTEGDAGSTSDAGPQGPNDPAMWLEDNNLKLCSCRMRAGGWDDNKNGILDLTEIRFNLNEVHGATLSDCERTSLPFVSEIANSNAPYMQDYAHYSACWDEYSLRNGYFSSGFTECLSNYTCSGELVNLPAHIYANINFCSGFDYKIHGWDYNNNGILEAYEVDNPNFGWAPGGPEMPNTQDAEHFLNCFSIIANVHDFDGFYECLNNYTCIIE